MTKVSGRLRYCRHTRHVVRHGHFTLKQLRLPVLNEMHKNSYTGPRLSGLMLLAIGHFHSSLSKPHNVKNTCRHQTELEIS